MSSPTRIGVAVAAAVIVIAVFGAVIALHATAGPRPVGGAAAWNFDKDAVGKVPKGIRIAETSGEGTLATWAVVKDSATPSKPNAFGITRLTNTGSTYNLAIWENTGYRDLELSVAFKANTGKEDQGGGPIWRYTDEDNYYICRANPLENNFRVYKVENGRRRQLASADVDIPSGKWLTIKVRMTGNRIECVYGAKTRLVVEDDTFAGAGRIGLWTKADAAVYFDDLRATPIAAEGT